MAHAVEPVAVDAPDSPEQNGGGAGQTLYLLGRPRLKDLIRFARSHAVTPPDEAALADQWQTAHEVVRRIETQEAGVADDPSITKLGPEYEPLLLELFADPLVRKGFNTVPTDVALVELDRLVVYQKHIDITFAENLARALGRAPSAEQVFRTCLLHHGTQPPVKWCRVHQDKFIFMSPSNDLRFLGAVPLNADQIKDYPSRGKFVGIVGVAVGFGSNFLHAIYAERRLILNNGSHRAYALRKLGVTHVPCIIEHASSRDEVEAVAAEEVRRHPDAYLKHPRPSMLRDYFNPSVHVVLPVYRRLRQVAVRFEVEENSVPAL